MSINYVDKIFSEVNGKEDLEMHSASLKFIFKNSFGFDTLTVNGCFQEARSGGLKGAKNLAIENLNNLGIKFNYKLAFHLKFCNLL